MPQRNKLLLQHPLIIEFPVHIGTETISGFRIIIPYRNENILNVELDLICLWAANYLPLGQMGKGCLAVEYLVLIEHDCLLTDISLPI